MKRTILCIDLKSFYASCECILLKKDPFTTSLVVANKSQGNGAITLAITPYLKNLGVKSRGRLYEIPKGIKYEIINPKMGYYVEKSKEVISIYLDFISKDDLHVYSVDEAFLDVTNYLKYYNLEDISLAKKIMDTIYNKTGLYSSCGIGENMFIAKTAMDIEGKKNKNSIAKWDILEAKEKIRNLESLTDMWGIGKNMEKKLNKLRIYTTLDLANYDKNKLKEELGVIGEELWNHANCIDEAIICENTYYPKNISYASSQILLKDYYLDNITLIIKETTEVLSKRLRENNKVCKKVYLEIGYSLEVNKHFKHSYTFDNYTRDVNEIYNYIIFILNKFVEDYPIRKISISLGLIKTSDCFQTSLFINTNQYIKDDLMLRNIDSIHKKYGKNSLIKASNLTKDSTLIKRNNSLGGHSL